MTRHKPRYSSRASKFSKSLEGRPRKAASYVQRDRTKTDTGRRDEKSQALGRTVVKELCKMAP
jgi:hypothetical protein